MNEEGKLSPLHQRTSSPHLTEEEQIAVTLQVPPAQRKLWKKFLDQQMQAEQSNTEPQGEFWHGLFNQSREKEHQNYDEARAEMSAIFGNRDLQGGQRVQEMPTSVSAGGGGTPSEVTTRGRGGTPQNPNRGTRRRERGRGRRQ